MLQAGRQPVHPARLRPLRRALSSSLTPPTRHSHRSGNPEPFLLSNLLRVCRNAPGRTSACPPGASAPSAQGLVIVINPHPPSFSLQWESRALSPIQPEAGLQECSRLDVGLTTRLVCAPCAGPCHRHYPPPPRHSHRSGNPEPSLPSNLKRVCRNAPGWTSGCPPGASAPLAQGLVIVIDSSDVDCPLRSPSDTCRFPIRGTPPYHNPCPVQPPAGHPKACRPKPVQAPKQNLTMPLRQHGA